MSSQLKKTTTTAVKKSSPSHPTYKEMIREATASCTERKGATRKFIAKYLSEQHKVTMDTKLAKANVRKALKGLHEDGVIVNPNGNVARFKLAKPKAPEGGAKKKTKSVVATKKVAAKKKPAAKKAETTGKKAKPKSTKKKAPVKKSVTAAKKTTVKKVAAKKSAAKKSPKKAAKKPAGKKAAPKRK